MSELIYYIQKFFVDLLLIINEMSPYLMVGLFFAGVLKVFLPEPFIIKHLHKNNIRSVINATLLGIPLPLCSCGVLPTGISLYKRGASKGATNAFFTATPQTGIDSILVNYGMLGLPMAIISPFVALASGVISGLVTMKITKNDNSENFKNSYLENTSSTPKLNFAQRIVEIFRYAFFTFLADIARWLIIGVTIAALISLLLPDSFFSDYVPKGILGMLIILLASTPLYICATASIPIAAILLSKGISPGTILVFLMAGPATNAASYTLIGNTLGKRSLISYLASIIAVSIGFGLLIDAFLPIEWFRVNHIVGAHVHGGKTWVFWLKTASTIILITLIVYIYLQKNIKNRKSIKKDKNVTIYQIPDLTCDHCKKTLEKAFNAIDKVKKVEVSLAQKTIYIKGTISDKEVSDIVKEQGFIYKGRV